MYLLHAGNKLSSEACEWEIVSLKKKWHPFLRELLSIYSLLINPDVSISVQQLVTCLTFVMHPREKGTTLDWICREASVSRSALLAWELFWLLTTTLPFCHAASSRTLLMRTVLTTLFPWVLFPEISFDTSQKVEQFSKAWTESGAQCGIWYQILLSSMTSHNWI